MTADQILKLTQCVSQLQELIEELTNADLDTDSFGLEIVNDLCALHDKAERARRIGLRNMRGMAIDHIDGNPRNNEISNLRLVYDSGESMKALGRDIKEFYANHWPSDEHFHDDYDHNVLSEDGFTFGDSDIIDLGKLGTINTNKESKPFSKYFSLLD